MSKRDGISKRKGSPYWWASWTDEQGRRYRRSTKCVEKRKAAQKLAQWKTETHNTSASSPAYTVRELMQMYVADLARRSTADSLPPQLPGLFQYFGAMTLPLIGQDIKAYIEQRRLAGISDTTIHNALTMLSAVINYGRIHLEMDIPNPVAGRKPKVSAPRSRWLTHDEAATLIDAAKASPWSDYMPSLIQFYLATGTRRNEALKLTWDRVDLKTGLLYFDPGTQKAERMDSIPINQIARRVLAERLKIRALHSNLVFHRAGIKLHPNAVSQRFTNLATDAGIEDCTLRDLRRTAGSWLVQQGVSIQETSRFLRHANIDITHKVYAHLAPDQIRAAAEKLEFFGTN